MANQIPYLSLANEGNRLRITYDNDGSVVVVTVTAVEDRQIRVRYGDGSEGLLRDSDYEDDVIEVLNRHED